MEQNFSSIIIAKFREEQNDKQKMGQATEKIKTVKAANMKPQFHFLLTKEELSSDSTLKAKRHKVLLYLY